MTHFVERAPRAGFAGFAALAFGAAVYVFFLGTFLYTIGFVANAPFLATTIDRGVSSAPLPSAFINLALLGVFAVQHSVMARPAFKRMWTRFVPMPIERSTYVLAATLCVFALIWFWHPMPELVWRVDSPVVANALWGAFALGWGVVLLATFLINHFELFGLRQVLAFATGHDIPAQKFHAPSLYKYVRHPLYLGFVIAFWAIPVMSQGHLLFAVMCTIYILIGIYFEERDLIAHFGEKYRAYQKRVPMLLPFGGKRQ